MPSNGYWDSLSDEFGKDPVDRFRRAFGSEEAFLLRVLDVARTTGATRERSTQLLERLATDGHLERRTRSYCASCGKQLEDDDIADLACESCGEAIGADTVTEENVYLREGERARDLRWLVTVHGMNTRGAWQEEFSWEVAKAFGYSIPTFVHKYGKVLLSPFLTIRQNRYRDKLVEVLSRRRTEMGALGYTEKPDVIAHSFGTWLLAEALRNDEELAVGRVVLTGSIVRPDFAWRDLIREQRVEAVLCHCAGKDLWVRLAPYFLPRSGPSGHIGFDDRTSVTHWYSPDLGHSGFFSDALFRGFLKGPWTSFMTCADTRDWAAAETAHDLPVRGIWKPPRTRILSHALKYLAFVALLAFLATVVYALFVGFQRILSN